MVTMFMKNEDFTINILTTDGPQYDYLIYVLENIFTINVVIREPGKYQRKRLISRKNIIVILAIDTNGFQEKFWDIINIE